MDSFVQSSMSMIKGAMGSSPYQEAEEQTQKGDPCSVEHVLQTTDKILPGLREMTDSSNDDEDQPHDHAPSSSFPLIENRKEHEQKGVLKKKSNRLLIEIKDPSDKCVQLEKQLAAVQRAVVRPLQQEIALLKMACPNDELDSSVPELEIILMPSTTMDCSSPRSDRGEEEKDEDYGRGDPPDGDDATRDDSDKREWDRPNLVDQELRYQIEGELLAMRDSLERNKEWRAFYAYHLERFRQMHNHLTNQYHVTLKDVDKQRHYMQQQLATAERDADATRHLMANCSEDIVQTRKEQDKVKREFMAYKRKNEKKLKKIEGDRDTTVSKLKDDLTMCVDEIEDMEGKIKKLEGFKKEAKSAKRLNGVFNERLHVKTKDVTGLFAENLKLREQSMVVRNEAMESNEKNKVQTKALEDTSREMQRLKVDMANGGVHSELVALNKSLLAQLQEMQTKMEVQDEEMEQSRHDVTFWKDEDDRLIKGSKFEREANFDVCETLQRTLNDAMESEKVQEIELQEYRHANESFRLQMECITSNMEIERECAEETIATLKTQLGNAKLLINEQTNGLEKRQNNIFSLTEEVATLRTEIISEKRISLEQNETLTAKFQAQLGDAKVLIGGQNSDLEKHETNILSLTEEVAMLRICLRSEKQTCLELNDMLGATLKELNEANLQICEQNSSLDTRQANILFLTEEAAALRVEKESEKKTRLEENESLTVQFQEVLALKKAQEEELFQAELDNAKLGAQLEDLQSEVECHVTNTAYLIRKCTAQIEEASILTSAKTLDIEKLLQEKQSLTNELSTLEAAAEKERETVEEDSENVGFEMESLRMDNSLLDYEVLQLKSHLESVMEENVHLGETAQTNADLLEGAERRNEELREEVGRLIVRVPSTSAIAIFGLGSLNLDNTPTTSFFDFVPPTLSGSTDLPTLSEDELNESIQAQFDHLHATMRDSDALLSAVARSVILDSPTRCQEISPSTNEKLTSPEVLFSTGDHATDHATPDQPTPLPVTFPMHSMENAPLSGLLINTSTMDEEDINDELSVSSSGSSVAPQINEVPSPAQTNRSFENCINIIAPVSPSQSATFALEQVDSAEQQTTTPEHQRHWQPFDELASMSSDELVALKQFGKSRGGEEVPTTPVAHSKMLLANHLIGVMEGKEGSDDCVLEQMDNLRELLFQETAASTDDDYGAQSNFDDDDCAQSTYEEVVNATSNFEDVSKAFMSTNIGGDMHIVEFSTEVTEAEFRARELFDRLLQNKENNDADDFEDFHSAAESTISGDDTYSMVKDARISREEDRDRQVDYGSNSTTTTTVHDDELDPAALLQTELVAAPSCGSMLHDETDREEFGTTFQTPTEEHVNIGTDELLEAELSAVASRESMLVDNDTPPFDHDVSSHEFVPVLNSNGKEQANAVVSLESSASECLDVELSPDTTSNNNAARAAATPPVATDPLLAQRSAVMTQLLGSQERS